MFETYSDIKFYKNMSIGSGSVTCGRTDRPTERQATTKKKRVFLLNFSNASKQTEALSFMDLYHGSKFYV